MFELIIDKNLASEHLLADAMSVHNGKRNLGTIGIHGNIIRSKAIARIRKLFAKAMGFDVDKICSVSYRASNLEKINKLNGN